MSTEPGLDRNVCLKPIFPRNNYSSVTAYESVTTCCDDFAARANALASTQGSQFPNMMDYLQPLVKTSLRLLIQHKEAYRTCSYVACSWDIMRANGALSRDVVRCVRTSLAWKQYVYRISFIFSYAIR
jgi:hypothetical protein